MPWVEFTADHVKARLAARELEVYEQTATAESEEGEPTSAVPRLPEIVEQLAAQIRGLIRSNPRVTAMGPAGTIPDFCVFHAAMIASVAMIALNPIVEGITDPRRDEYNAAKEFMKSLPTMNPSAFGDDPPASPASPAAPAFGGNPMLDF